MAKQKASKKTRDSKVVSLARANRRKHYKPIRIRHLSLLLLASALVGVFIFKAGMYYAQTRPTGEESQTAIASNEDVIVRVASAYGFSTEFNTEVFKGTYQLLDGSEQAINKTLALTEQSKFIALSVRPEAVNSFDAALQVQLEVDSEELSKVSDHDVRLVKSQTVKIGGSPSQIMVYELTPQAGSQKNKTYIYHWSKSLGEHNLTVRVVGLTHPDFPAVVSEVFESISFDSAVLGARTDNFASGFFAEKVSAAQNQRDYVIDSVSPAVVKIYHITCGTLIVFGEPLSSESCEVTTGSGFFVSSDGYIATNGHVVVNQPEDIFVKTLMSNPSSLKTFLNGAGLSQAEIDGINRNPVLLASVISKVYDLPDEAIDLQNESHVYFAALGIEPLQIDSIDDAKLLQSFEGNRSIKRLDLVAKNYSSKDVYSVSAGEGFSSSDVALLKADAKDTPFIRLFDRAVSQNMSISIVGFPGDAENFLIDKTQLAPTVTTGSISAIRSSSGSGDYALFQSDADASSGSSGGPVLSVAGQAIGLLTYRYQGSEQTDAAKSYIRDIADLQKLANVNNIVFRFDGDAQSSWETGLDYYAQHRYSKALVSFREVAEAYPSHRLVGTYILDAEKAVAQGRDVSDTPLMLIVGGMAGLTGVIAAIIIIVRHHGHHQRFKFNHSQTAHLPVAGL